MLRRLVLPLVLLSVAIACGSDSSGPVAVSVVGLFQLKTVNGTPLPATISSSLNSHTDLTADQLSVNADGTWSETSSFRIVSGATTTTTQGASIGVYQAANGQISFTETTPTPGTFSASVNGNTLTAIVTGVTLVYQR